VNTEVWIFANPAIGKPYWPGGRIQENWLVPAAVQPATQRSTLSLKRIAGPRDLDLLAASTQIPRPEEIENVVAIANATEKIVATQC
jgi:hypothetical protein